MEIKVFREPSPDYRVLVNRLYGREAGQGLADRYEQWLSPDRQWTNRLSWVGVAAYEGASVIGHLVIQLGRADPIAFIGFVELENNQAIADSLMKAARELIPAERFEHVFAPVDLSIWHAHRFTIAKTEGLPFHNPQKAYYRDLFGRFFHKKYLYCSYEWPIKINGKRKELPVGTIIRPAQLHKSSKDWENIYRITRAAFQDTPSPPSFEEFVKLYSDFSKTIEPEDIVVAEYGGTLLGYALQGIIKGILAVKTVAVDPMWQGRGIGTALYRRSLERAQERGCTTAILLYLRTDRLIDRLRPLNSKKVSDSVLFQSLKT